LGGGKGPQRPDVGGIGGGNKPGIGSGARPGGGATTLPARPGVNVPGAARPVDPGFSRPGVGTRPAGPGVGTLPSRPVDPGYSRPGVGTVPNRPAIDNRPNVNRPNLDLGNRVTQNNINNINVNRWNQYNRQANVNRHWSYRPTYWNRPWYDNRPAWYWSRPWYNYHWGWHYGYWNYWRTPPAFWFGLGATAGFLASPGDTYVYSNPYYVQPTTTVIVQPALDYSSPIPAPAPDQQADAYPPDPTMSEDGTIEDLSTAAPPAPSTQDSTVNDANKQFDAAREAFKGGGYAKAQGLAEKALALLPSDATLHEFRALTLFAQKKYKDAAAGLYAVLAAGPGWDWKTMSSLYHDVDTYTQQLRALETYSAEHRDEADAHFLLAYHYLILESKDAAVRQLKEVVLLVPNDKLSAALLKALTTPEEPPAPASNEKR
jgi:tetratricopeptide (TPR) repeat protein